MSKLKVKATIFLDIDTDEYHIPADLNLQEQISEDIEDAISRAMSVTVNLVSVNKVQHVKDGYENDED